MLHGEKFHIKSRNTDRAIVLSVFSLTECDALSKGIDPDAPRHLSLAIVLENK